jgi:hypothetical protein
MFMNVINTTQMKSSVIYFVPNTILRHFSEIAKSDY